MKSGCYIKCRILHNASLRRDIWWILLHKISRALTITSRTLMLLIYSQWTVCIAKLHKMSSTKCFSRLIFQSNWNILLLLNMHYYNFWCSKNIKNTLTDWMWCLVMAKLWRSKNSWLAAANTQRGLNKFPPGDATSLIMAQGPTEVGSITLREGGDLLVKCYQNQIFWSTMCTNARNLTLFLSIIYSFIKCNYSILKNQLPGYFPDIKTKKDRELWVYKLFLLWAKKCINHTC